MYSQVKKYIYTCIYYTLFLYLFYINKNKIYKKKTKYDEEYYQVYNTLPTVAPEDTLVSTFLNDLPPVICPSKALIFGAPPDGGADASESLRPPVGGGGGGGGTGAGAGGAAPVWPGNGNGGGGGGTESGYPDSWPGTGGGGGGGGIELGIGGANSGTGGAWSGIGGACSGTGGACSGTGGAISFEEYWESGSGVSKSPVDEDDGRFK